MDKPGIGSREEAISTLSLLSAFCLFSFAAVCLTPLPLTHPAGQFYLGIITGLASIVSLWSTYREIQAARDQLSWRRIEILILPLLLVALGAWLRMRNLTAIDTWQDEDHQLSGTLVRDNLIVLAATSHQAPLAYFQGGLMMKIGGVSLFTARLLPAILGSLAVIPFYRLLRKFVSLESAILGAIFFLGNTLLWSLSQEGRPYMAAVFLLVTSLHLWVEFCLEPTKRHVLLAFVVAQATLFVTLTMQPQFTYVFYLLPLLYFTGRGHPLRIREFVGALLVSGTLALPVMLTAALELPHERQIQPFAPGFLTAYWPTMAESLVLSLGPLLWAAPALLAPLFLRSRETSSEPLGKSIWALSLIYPFLFYFCFEGVLSTPVTPRYITFLVVLYIFALTYSLDRLAPLKGYRYYALVLGSVFMAHAVSADSIKVREPGWRQFYEYVSQNEESLGIGVVLDFPLDWPFPTQGFRGVYTYASLYRDKLSLRSHSDRTASATGDLIQRLEKHPAANIAFLYLPASAPDNLLYDLPIPASSERKILKFDHAKVIRIEANEGALPSAIRDTLFTAAELDPRITHLKSYRELLTGFYLLEGKCQRAMELWAKQPHPEQRQMHRKTFEYLNSLIVKRCGSR